MILDLSKETCSSIAQCGLSTVCTYDSAGLFIERSWAASRRLFQADGPHPRLRLQALLYLIAAALQ